MVSFNQIPSGIKTPFVYVEFDNSRAQQGPSLQEYKILVMGQMLSSGTATALDIIPVTQADQAKSLFGNGSMLAETLEFVFNANKVNQVLVMPIDDNGAGTESTGTITFTGPATEAGTFTAYIGGKKIQVGVSVGDSADDVAAALDAAITAESNISVTSGVVTNVVTLTAKHKGLIGDEIDVRINYFDDEVTPAGISATVVAMNGGAGNPDLTTAIAAIDDDQYNIVIAPYTDSSNMTLLENELEDRWGPLLQNDGHMITAKRDSFSNLVTLGNGRNSKQSTIMSIDGPHSPWQWAGALGGVVALNGQIDPARPFQTLTLPGIFAPSKSERFNQGERHQLLSNGIATHIVDAGGNVKIERVITTFQTNSFGAPDTSYLDLNTKLTLSFLRFDFKAIMSNKYPRHKLASDTARIAPGQPILTPKRAKAEAVAIFRGWEDLGLVENIDQFKNDLIVERNAQDVNRLDFLLPPDLVNQLRVVGAQVQFLL